MSRHDASSLQQFNQTTETYLVAEPDLVRIYDNHAAVGESRFQEQELVEESPQAAHLRISQARRESFRKSILNGSRPQLLEIWPQRPHPRRSGTFPLRRGDPGAIGVAISKPAAGLQWSSRDRGNGNLHRLTNSPTKETARVERTIPHNQPNLSYVPLLDIRSPGLSSGAPSKNTVKGWPTQEYLEDSFQRSSGSLRVSLPNKSPGSLSRPSTTVSVGTISDFPNLGPYPLRKNGHFVPFAPRRGNSSYYSQYSSVAPIPEESPEQQWTHGSFASSRVIPSSWGSGPSEQVLSPNLDRGEDGEDYVVDDIIDGPSATSDDDTEHRPVLNNGREEQNGPSLISSNGIDDGKARTVAPSFGDDIMTSTAMGSKMRGPDIFLKSATSEESLAKRPLILNTDTASSPISVQSRSPTVSPNGSATYHILHEPRKGTLPVKETVPGARAPMKSLAENQSLAPGPPLHGNMNRMKPTEVRSSLTSLPEMIKRATRLASVLDRERPASRLGSPQSPIQTEKGGGDRMESRFHLQGWVDNEHHH